MTEVRIQPADERSGDGILEIPDAIMAALGWSIGDQLAIELLPEGAIVMKRLDDPEKPVP